MAKKKKGGGDSPILASNRSASHVYHLEHRIEAGIVLLGSEVKSVRAGKINLKEAYARISGGELFLIGAHISPYSHARSEEIDPVRRRKLLLHAAEIRKLARELEGTGMTLVPTKAYLKNGRVKIEIAVGRGKKLHDKREARRKRETEREIARASSLKR
ncbi:MAG: SsrA-binding protein SmpB [Acidobacteria bacterium]|nr:SsrA-binding protein SmpB [Acidobacteriota bacterium]NIM63750.1 SsrA-binding protein SmpB [Acidobacteriota bacterium]NIO59319.1 SsrA-binding protein SmpB [Acidobacteriota bacterium]NIQ30333.1 SsrA-binding protein SmpB [Acidobacteriota bacterium]NIQ85270.1 SsrA-binding protein SmpB [Acidobacteriota bacterium]